MKFKKYTFTQLAAVCFIIVCTSIGWAILGLALVYRTHATSSALDGAVKAGWGEPLVQTHPFAWYSSPTGKDGRKILSPERSDVTVRLNYLPRQKGLLWFRTYDLNFSGIYQMNNPTKIEQTIYASFQLPKNGEGCFDVVFELGDRRETINPSGSGVLSDALVISPGESKTLKVSFKTRGTDQWMYGFENSKRIQNFQLTLVTNFREINFPVGAGSPTGTTTQTDGWQLVWRYPDVIGAQAIGMTMPNVLNPGPVAARISFYAPVSLLFFATVLLVQSLARNLTIHPMNFFFISAGFFSFQLLFAYLVDILPLHASLLISAIISMSLVCGYIHAVAGRALSFFAVPAQAAYMVLFSYSFFIEGFSGLTIAIGSVLTLAFLMVTTAKIDWSQRFDRGPMPPSVTAQ